MPQEWHLREKAANSCKQRKPRIVGRCWGTRIDTMIMQCIQRWCRSTTVLSLAMFPIWTFLILSFSKRKPRTSHDSYLALDATLIHGRRSLSWSALLRCTAEGYQVFILGVSTTWTVVPCDWNFLRGWGSYKREGLCVLSQNSSFSPLMLWGTDQSVWGRLAVNWSCFLG